MTATLDQLAAEIQQLRQQVQSLQNAQASRLQPTLITVNPDGTIGADFTGTVNALGVILPSAPQDNQTGVNEILWQPPAGSPAGSQNTWIFAYEDGALFAQNDVGLTPILHSYGVAAFASSYYNAGTAGGEHAGGGIIEAGQTWATIGPGQTTVTINFSQTAGPFSQPPTVVATYNPASASWAAYLNGIPAVGNITADGFEFYASASDSQGLYIQWIAMGI